MSKRLTTVEKNIGYTFSDKALLQLALTHKSASNTHNERLEFLGDAILSSVITGTIYARFQDKSEGELSRIRSYLIQKSCLIDVGTRLEIATHIQVSTNEKNRRQNNTGSILADALEALVGAIFLDSDWQTCADIILSWYLPELSDSGNIQQEKDAKTKLQEYMQAVTRPIPEYTVTETSGLDHDQIFTVECRVKGVRFKAQGTGKTIKKAQQQAALHFLEKLQTKESI